MEKRKEPDDSSKVNLSSTNSSFKRIKGCNRYCTLNFDGCSKGNPRKGGAGAILQADSGFFVMRLLEGVHDTTSNAPEYRALILGLRCALEYGFTHIRVKGDSITVCMQVQGTWKVKNKKLAKLCKEVKELSDQFEWFEIDHIAREMNTKADDAANKAIGLNLKDREVVKEFD